jgi:hypothetical protein
MTITEPSLPSTGASDATDGRLARAGGAAALLAAATFGFGITMFATSLADYTDPDAAPAASVEFLVDHQGTLLAWYLGIFIVFGAALVPLGLALRRRLAPSTPVLADTAAVFVAIWAALMFATGMISNIGIEAVADLAETDPASAPALWSSIDTVTNGLGGGNEIVGGLWILLISIAGLLSSRLPRWLNLVGVLTGVAGAATVVPGLEPVEMAFGLGSIVWFVGVGVVLLRSHDSSGAGDVAS